MNHRLPALLFCLMVLVPQFSYAQSGGVSDAVQIVDNSQWSIYVVNGTKQAVRITDFQAFNCQNVSTVCGYLYAGYVLNPGAQYNYLINKDCLPTASAGDPNNCDSVQATFQYSYHWVYVTGPSQGGTPQGGAGSSAGAQSRQPSAPTQQSTLSAWGNWNPVSGVSGLYSSVRCGSQPYSDGSYYWQMNFENTSAQSIAFTFTISAPGLGNLQMLQATIPAGSTRTTSLNAQLACNGQVGLDVTAQPQNAVVAQAATSSPTSAPTARPRPAQTCPPGTYAYSSAGATAPGYANVSCAQLSAPRSTTSPIVSNNREVSTALQAASTPQSYVPNGSAVAQTFAGQNAEIAAIASGITTLAFHPENPLQTIARDFNAASKDVSQNYFPQITEEFNSQVAASKQDPCQAATTFVRNLDQDIAADRQQYAAFDKKSDIYQEDRFELRLGIDYQLRASALAICPDPVIAIPDESEKTDISYGVEVPEGSLTDGVLKAVDSFNDAWHETPWQVWAQRDTFTIFSAVARSKGNSLQTRMFAYKATQRLCDGHFFDWTADVIQEAGLCSTLPAIYATIKDARSSSGANPLASLSITALSERVLKLLPPRAYIDTPGSAQTDSPRFHHTNTWYVKDCYLHQRIVRGNGWIQDLAYQLTALSDDGGAILERAGKWVLEYQPPIPIVSFNDDRADGTQPSTRSWNYSFPLVLTVEDEAAATSLSQVVVALGSKCRKN
jgi:hypothetical protein